MTPRHLIKDALDPFDYSDTGHQAHLEMMKKALLDSNDRLTSLEMIRWAANQSLPLELRIAMHLSRSRRFVESMTRPLKVGIVFAMWGEHNRLLPRSLENPNGEDTLRTKLNQLQMLFADSPVQWTLYAVDDGCPKGSGAIAREIAERHPLGDRGRILFLEEHLTTVAPLKRLKSVEDSRKGGAMILGCHKAIQDGNEVIIYTDADNSVHLGQLGILLDKYINEGFRVVLGDRKDQAAVLVKQEGRWGVGIKLLRHMQRMIGHSIFSKGIMDSQAAFKLYEARLLGEILQEATVYDFAFDSDWILASLKINEPFAKVPFAFIDSFAESASITQGPMTTWFALLTGLLRAVRARNMEHNLEMANVMDQEVDSHIVLELLIDSLPPELENVNDKQLGDPKIMSPEAVRTWIRSQKVASKV